MPGPTAWTQNLQTFSFSAQTITANTETVIATLTGINSRGPGFPVLLNGWAAFVVQAATTSVTMRIRQDSLTGSVVGAPGILAATAATTSQNTLDVTEVDTPAGEYAGKTYVLTVQAAAAGANWNVNAATLQAFF